MNSTKKFFSSILVILKTLLISIPLTLVFLLILTFLSFKNHMSSESIKVGLIIIYVINSFISGYIAGKISKIRRFLYGAIASLSLYIILLTAATIISGSFPSLSIHILPIIIFTVGGTIGGMFS